MKIGYIIRRLQGKFEVGDKANQRVRIKETGELIVAARKQGVELDTGEADMILGYLEGHDYCLMADDKGATVRHDEQYGDSHKGDEPYTVRDTIEFCQEMNDDLLRDECSQSEADEEYLLQLRADEQALASLVRRSMRIKDSQEGDFMPEERQNITIYTIVYTASDVDRGSFPIRQAQNSYLSLTAARAEWERKVAEEKAELDDRYDCEEQGDNYWEMYQDGYAAACFSRIEILTTTLYCEGGE